MSLLVNKENIFFILPESRYAVSDRIDRWMEEDFTVHLTAKLFPETLKNEQAYMFARNGMHSGISAFKDDFGNINVVFTYWFKDEDGQQQVKQIFYGLDDIELNEFNEYNMICDNFIERKIDCYVNNKLVGTIYFENNERQSYEAAFYWFGCGSMIGPEEHRGYGTFEYKLCFVLNKRLELLDIQDIVDNYKDKYSHIVFNDLRKLNYDYPLRQNFAFMCDFDHFNRYKVWDISFSGNYPQFYIEHNIYF
jgi:hypothetical protein